MESSLGLFAGSAQVGYGTRLGVPSEERKSDLVRFNPPVEIAPVKVNSSPSPNHYQFTLMDQMLNCLLGPADICSCFLDCKESS
jgi:hypothetical protein